MARIALASYTVRFPVGGYLSWTLQWLVGLQRLGHDVVFVEKAGWPDACFDSETRTWGDDCSSSVATVSAVLDRFGLGDRWCFVDWEGRYHGMSRKRVEKSLRAADLFLDTLGDGQWEEEVGPALTVYLDGEPGRCQMKMENRVAAGKSVTEYQRYYTVGLNVGTPRSSAPTAGKEWRSFFDPVVLDLYSPEALQPDASFTTVMSWQAHPPIEYGGRVYRQKDVEFAKFMRLPELTDVPLEIAVAGGDVPLAELEGAGWRVRDAHTVTASFDSWRHYIAASRAEFTVCKNVFVDTWSGWFSDRSACYLASGRPVVMQDTGFSEHLPCGEGLFAVGTVEEAAAAIVEIQSDYSRQSRAARRVAEEYLATDVVLPRLLAELGV